MKWDREADIVVIGSGATGLPAAIVAREAGSSVILVEAEADIGGHAIISGGNIPLGGGTSVQKKYGIEDSPDLLFRDLTDWSVVGPNGFPDYRYNDREIIRAFADNSALTFEWLVAHGVVFVDKAPDALGGNSVGNSVPREMHSAVMDWPMAYTGEPAEPAVQRTRSSGNGLMRSLEVAAKKAGVGILLEHRMTRIYRQAQNSGPVLGIAVDNKDIRLNIRAHKAVIIGTGGSTGNVNFRRMFDPRLTKEYWGLGGMPWPDQDASGEDSRVPATPAEPGPAEADALAWAFAHVTLLSLGLIIGAVAAHSGAAWHHRAQQSPSFRKGMAKWRRAVYRQANERTKVLVA